MRVASLILSATPFGVIVIFLYAIATSEGYDGFRLLVPLMVTMPVLLLVSTLAVVLAFRKNENNPDLAKVSRASSIVSLSVFGAATVLVVCGVILLQIQSANMISQYGS
jgi:uncharacterized membrane protein